MTENYANVIPIFKVVLDVSVGSGFAGRVNDPDIAEVVWNIGLLSKSTLINASDPVDNLVGYTWVRFRTCLPVLLVIKSLHFNPIKGVGRLVIKSKLEPGIEVDARGTF